MPMSANVRSAFHGVKTWFQSMLRNWFPRHTLLSILLLGLLQSMIFAVIIPPWWRNAIRVYLTATSQQCCTTPTASSLYGGWHHILFQRNGTTTVQLFIDGVLRLSYSDTLSIPAATSTYIYGYYSSTYSWANYSSGAEFIWENVAWSAQRVAKYYAYCKGRWGL